MFVSKKIKKTKLIIMEEVNLSKYCLEPTKNNIKLEWLREVERMEGEEL